MDDILIYLLMLIIPLIAQIYVKSTYSKSSVIKSKSKLSGYEVARKILDANNLKDMYIVKTKGELTDHYDPTRKTVRLSSDVYDEDSIASVAIAAHECGHAIQDKEGYLFFRIRSMIVPIVNLGTKAAYIVLVIGFFLELMDLVWLGIILVSLGLLFQLVTLPVELDASKRAKMELEQLGITDKGDLDKCKTMLTSAALTYVAGVLSSALEVLRLILIFTNRRDD